MISCRSDLLNRYKKLRLIYALEDTRELLKYYNPTTDKISVPTTGGEVGFKDMFRDQAVLTKRNNIYILLNLSETHKYLDTNVFCDNVCIGKGYSFSERNGNYIVNPDNGTLITIDPLEYTIRLIPGSYVVVTKDPVK